MYMIMLQDCLRLKMLEDKAMSEEKCVNCRYGVQTSYHRALQCRRRPPTAQGPCARDAREYYKFPWVDEDCWCGDWAIPIILETNDE